MGFQRPGGPSHASRLRGDGPSKAPIPLQNRNRNPSILNNAKNHLPNTPSNLGMYSQAHNRTQRPATADRRLPTDDSWKDSSANTVRTKSRLPEDDSWKNDAAGNLQNNSKADQQDVMTSMASLSISSAKNPEPVPKGRCLGWERPVGKSSIVSRVSKHVQKPRRDYLNFTPSAYSISYKRRHTQTPMEHATYREYLPFLRPEFKVGMIIRMNIHESDFRGTSKEEIAQASQASTLVEGGGGGKRRREHRHHGDYGPIYSENRIFIVVNKADDIYTAIPLFTHEGKGLARISDKNSWVSVEDHRQLGKCIRQSEHQPLRTAYLSPEADLLDPVSTAWIPYAFPCRYDVPVAYQGKLDKASTKRLVRLHRQTWVDEVSDED